VQHKLYNLDSKQTFLGIDMSDIMVGITTWMLGNFLAGEFLPPRLRMLSIFASVGIALTVWRALKDKLPPGFFRHLQAWASEANAYRIGPDTKARPAFVDHQRVLSFLEQEKSDRTQLARVSAKASAKTNGEIRPRLQHTVQLTPLPRTPGESVEEDSTPATRITVHPSK